MTLIERIDADLFGLYSLAGSARSAVSVTAIAVF
jgi:hypothetical protein